MSTVAEILQKKGPVFNFVEADTLVIDALSLIKTRNLSYLVVQKNGEYAGLVSERDYAQKVILMGKASASTTVEEIMTTNLPSVTSSTSEEDCRLTMNSYQTRYLPVIDHFDFKGVITIHDLMRETLQKSAERHDVY
ncbi:CBS domain-containing protein [Segetibacter koreensis]|uniref:CBS domain-containing protein n=1 Tax=Segetibacter koreensis TaxID=398037 RepID=UPI00037877F0|nr:CBS domain-containing protein [Segetibacter koreensis]